MSNESVDNFAYNLTQQIIERVKQLQFCEIPSEVFFQTERCLLDYCGVVLAGAKENSELNNAYLAYLPFSKAGTASLFGMGKKSDVYTAALLNGMNAHTIELDDGHRFGMLHMGAPIISAVFAVAESLTGTEGRNLDGEKILRAIICGYEVAISLARHMQPGHKLKGYHATGTCCTVGAAMSIAVLLDYVEVQIQGALSAAATSAAGLLEVIDDGSQLKPYNVGRAAMDGLAAAFTGGAGFKGPDDVIGGKRGFFAVLASADDYSKVKGGRLFKGEAYTNKSAFAIMEIYTKPYAACRHCHPAIEGAVMIRKQVLEQRSAIFLDGVEKVVVHTYKLAIGGHDHTTIQGVNSAKMSTPYSVAVALLEGLVGMNAYCNEKLCDDNIRQLISKVEVRLNPELDALNPQKRAAIVELRLKDGNVYRARVDYPRGEPENRMDDEELEEKFSVLAKISGKSPDCIKKIKKTVWNYRQDANKLFEQLI